MKSTWLLCIALCAPVQAASAQSSSEYSAAYDDCVEAAGPINNAVVQVCASRVSERAKEEIEQRYRSIHARLRSSDPADADKFEASQKAWLTYRNAHCALAGSHIGSPMYDYCPMTLNSARALELRELDGG
ncbi:DUF1311 domain-containing protein [Luteimonas sp. Y-2-2-4F]|nr:lysozyme inhibitor LprI family protein [Luteimonas sp. Y-2-2-4F]MCD9031014.1 DUF1311 domain-containing protein [Luteimonas sp. Y-2-2-4F]